MAKTAEMMDGTHKRNSEPEIEIDDETEEELLRCGCGEFGEANYFADDEPRYICRSRWCMP